MTSVNTTKIIPSFNCTHQSLETRSKMSQKVLSPFQKHLLFFATPSSRPQLTIISALRAGVSLGLDFPVSVALSIALRVMYAPFPYFWKPVFVDSIPASQHRTQLSSAELPKSKANYTCSELLNILGNVDNKGFVKHKIDQGHIVGFWTMAANAHTHRVSRDDVERFQGGEWESAVVARRKARDDVLPLWRGGPIWTTGHSVAVNKLLGVQVYEEKKE